MNASSALAVWSRLVLLIVLIAGQVVTPGFATLCDVGDALSLAQSQNISAPVADATRPDVPDNGDCCEGGCVDCCLHAPPVLVSPLRLPSIALIAIVPDWRTPPFVPGTYPVDIRPPIAS